MLELLADDNFSDDEQDTSDEDESENWDQNKKQEQQEQKQENADGCSQSEKTERHNSDTNANTAICPDTEIRNTLTNEMQTGIHQKWKNCNNIKNTNTLCSEESQNDWDMSIG